MESIGIINWWGTSPTFDLQKYTRENKDEINFLLIGAGDSRHIIKTLASLKLHNSKKINFYVIEGRLELYARQMLLLKLFFKETSEIGINDKVEYFLEIFGNSLVREQTMELVKSEANEFIKMVTDFDYLHTITPYFDLSFLKFKERDFLEGIFKFWRNETPKNIFDISNCWDKRLRRHLKERYDAIPNIFDWDYSMKLCDKEAGIIGVHNYKRWRRNGVAFEIREANYGKSNKTLASGRVFNHNGERVPIRGYWGDIITSPYISFGIEGDDESYFKKINNIYAKSSEDVSVYNLTSYLQQGRCAKDSSNDFEKADIQNIKLDSDNINSQDLSKNDTSQDIFNLCDTKIYFLSLPQGVELTWHDVFRKDKFKNFFDVVFVGNSLSHLVGSEMSEIFTNKSTLIMESAKYLIELSKDSEAKLNRKLIDLAETAGGVKLFKDENIEKEALLIFNFDRV